MPQPYFGPVMRSSSRRTRSSGIAGSTTSWLCPLTFSFMQGSLGSTSHRIEPESKTVLPFADGTAESSAFATADALMGL